MEVDEIWSPGGPLDRDTAKFGPQEDHSIGTTPSSTFRGVSFLHFREGGKGHCVNQIVNLRLS